MASTPMSATRETIVSYLRAIDKHDPEGLGGVRTTSEIGSIVGLRRDATRHHLDTLVHAGTVECVGVMIGEPHQPTGWKIAS